MFTNYARVGTCLPARSRLAPGRGRAASCRFADIGRLVGRFPDLVIYSAASSAGERASSTSSPYISCGRCSAMPPRRIWPPTVLPSARAKVPAAPADLTSLAADAAPCRRAGGGHLQCCHQRWRKSQRHQQTLRLLRQSGALPSVSPLVRRCEMLCRPAGRCGAGPSCRKGFACCAAASVGQRCRERSRILTNGRV